MTITPCARCKQPAILHTVAGEGAWDAERGEFRASYVAPEFPEECLLRRVSGSGAKFCTSGACKSPEDAIKTWNMERGKERLVCE